MNDIIVSVKDSHIKIGEKCSCFDCPISLAIIDAYGKNKWEKQYLYRQVSVAKNLKITSSSIVATYDTLEFPKEMEKWIIDFDNGLPVLPFKFKLIQTKYYPFVPEAKIEMVH